MRTATVIFGRVALAAGLAYLCAAPFMADSAMIVVLTQALTMLTLAML